MSRLERDPNLENAIQLRIRDPNNFDDFLWLSMRLGIRVHFENELQVWKKKGPVYLRMNAQDFCNFVRYASFESVPPEFKPS